MIARADLAGPGLRSALTQLADTWLAHLLGDSAGVALVAVGGYGRREPAPGSDLDLVLLHDGKRAGVAELADRLWYPVWDAGVGLDHAVRTVREALSVAEDDLKAALGLLDARHVAGDAGLTDQLHGQVRARWRATAPTRLPELVVSVYERAQRHGEAAFLVEPDLKECRGGLRDVHAIRAVAAAWLVDAPSVSVRSAARRLLDVRGELHRRTGRGGDRLVLEEQPELAATLGYPHADELLRAVSAAARRIAFACDQAEDRVAGLRRERRPLTRRSKPQWRPLDDGLIEQDGQVVLARGADPAADPFLPLRAATAAAHYGLPLSQPMVNRCTALTPAPALPWPPPALDCLVALLGSGPSAVPVLETLDQAGLLVRLLPAWKLVRNRPQRDPYHRYTVDRHLIETAVVASGLASRVNRPDLLLLGAFLHDIGKGSPGDHSVAGAEIAAGIGRDLGLSHPDAAVLADLVRWHLLLAETATRRDLDDPATVQRVAAAVGGDPDVLDLLAALAEADARATGPTAWGSWRAALVGDLVARVRACLGGAPPRPVDSTAADRELAAGVADVPERLVVGNRNGCLSIATADRPGLLWRAAGVLALHRLDVRQARTVTVDDTAVLRFTVGQRYGEEFPPLGRLRADLRLALDGTLRVLDRLDARERAYTGRRPPAEPVVTLVDDASAAATVVEVHAGDSAGLLARLAYAISEAGLVVRSARADTLGGRVVDVFYVVTPDGRIVGDDELRDRLTGELCRVARRVTSPVGW